MKASAQYCAEIVQLIAENLCTGRIETRWTEYKAKIDKERNVGRTKGDRKIRAAEGESEKKGTKGENN